MNANREPARGSTPDEPMAGSNEFYIREHGLGRAWGQTTYGVLPPEILSEVEPAQDRTPENSIEQQ